MDAGYDISPAIAAGFQSQQTVDLDLATNFLFSSPGTKIGQDSTASPTATETNTATASSGPGNASTGSPGAGSGGGAGAGGATTTPALSGTSIAAFGIIGVIGYMILHHAKHK